MLDHSGKYECINLLSMCANLNINVPVEILGSADVTFSFSVSIGMLNRCGMLFTRFWGLLLTGIDKYYQIYTKYIIVLLGGIDISTD